MTITFNGVDYIATYNQQTGYYELNLQAPEIGGIYTADISFNDLSFLSINSSIIFCSGNNSTYHGPKLGIPKEKLEELMK